MDQSRFQQQQVSSGLTRYRSAPSSYFASLLSSTPASVGVGGGIGGVGCGYARDDFDQLLDSRGSCTNLQQDLATFVASVGDQDSNLSNFGSNQKIQHNLTSNVNVGSDSVSLKRNDEAQLNNRHQKLARHRSSDYSSILQMNYLSQDQQSQFISSVKQEIETQQQHLQRQQSSDFSSGSQMNYQSQAQNSKFSSSVKQETETQQLQHGGDYSAVPLMNYQSQAQQNDSSRATSSAMDNSFRFSSSVRSDHLTPVTMGSGVGVAGGNSNLTRYNSSPAGFFSSIDIDYEYGATRGFSNNASPRLMAPISEIGDKGMEESSAGDEIFGECNKNVESNITGFPMASWEDSLILSDDFLKVPEDSESQPFSNVNTSENQNSEGRARPLLSHHLSLPTSTMEKLLEDSVPMRSRAKRGCATHPRSIAERVRRTRISDRMRKLQELVPNMDKQTNTSDMLDLAVDYIKDLKKEVKILSEKRDKCVCTKK